MEEHGRSGSGGGGAQLPIIKRELAQYNPAVDFCRISPTVKAIELPGRIRVLGTRDDLRVAEYASFLTVAYGASFHIGEIWDFFKPRDIGPDKARRAPEKDGPFFGHWW